MRTSSVSPLPVTEQVSTPLVDSSPSLPEFEQWLRQLDAAAATTLEVAHASTPALAHKQRCDKLF